MIQSQSRILHELFSIRHHCEVKSDHISLMLAVESDIALKT